MICQNQSPSLAPCLCQWPPVDPKGPDLIWDIQKKCAQCETSTKFLINSQKCVQDLNYQISDAFLSTAPLNDFPGQRTQLTISWEFPLLPPFSTDFACCAVPWVVLLQQQLIGQSIHWDQLNSVHEIKWRLCDSSCETQTVWPGVLCLCAELQCAHVKGSVTAWTWCLWCSCDT